MDQKAINSWVLATNKTGSFTKRYFICLRNSIGKNSFQDLRTAYFSHNLSIYFADSPLHFMLNSSKYFFWKVSKISKFSKYYYCYQSGPVLRTYGPGPMTRTEKDWIVFDHTKNSFIIHLFNCRIFKINYKDIKELWRLFF